MQPTTNGTGDIFPASEPAFRIGASIYIPRRKIVSNAQGFDRLEPRLCRLLDLFIEHPGQPLEREFLLESVWPGEGSDEALTQAVSRLRRCLGADVIETRPRFGYCLSVVPVPAVAELPDESSRRKTRRFHLPLLRSSAIFGAGLASGVIMSLLLAPVIFHKQIEIEEIVQPPDGDIQIVRTSLECSLLENDCEPRRDQRN